MPEVIEDFFIQAGPVVGVHPKESPSAKPHLPPRPGAAHLWPIGERLEPRFGKLGSEYKQIVFDKALLDQGRHAGMGHARPSAVRGRARGRLCEHVRERSAARGGLLRPANGHRLPPRCVLGLRQGRPWQRLHRRLFVVQTEADGEHDRTTAHALPRPCSSARRTPGSPSRTDSPPFRSVSMLSSRSACRHSSQEIAAQQAPGNRR